MSRLSPAPQFGEALPLEASDPVLRFLARRRSVSAVTLEAPAPSPTELDELLRLATRAPDHGKLSPWRFIVADSAAKATLVDSLDRLARDRGDGQAAGKLAKLRLPPLAVFVVSAPKPGPIPEWEQILSAGAVCTNLLNAALAMGYGANWITDWYSYDPDALKLLGLREGERVAGCILLGTPREPPLERERPSVERLVTRWSG